MSATITAPRQAPARPQPAPSRLAPAPGRRPRPGQAGRQTSPQARPVRPLSPPVLQPLVDRRGHTCSADELPVAVPQVAAAGRTRTRLTDRGIVVILVAGAMIVVAAVAVVGLTALRVTGDVYQPTTVAQLTQP